MPVTISGSGTITGIATGGLPDGSIASSDLADNAVTAGKLASSLDLTGKTVTLPSGTGGKILQVVQTAKTDPFSTTSTSYTDITGLSVTITPSDTSSKILVIPDLSISGDTIIYARLLKGSTEIYGGDAGTENGIFGSYCGPAGDGLYVYGHANVHRMFLDSPATTSAITYKCQFKVSSSTGYVNRTKWASGGYDIRTASSITAIEVAA